jgi:PKD repeat protein
MKKLLKYTYIAAIVCALQACSGDVLPTTFDAPAVFGIQGTLGSDNISIEAGRNGYYLYTQKSYGTDSVFTFTSALKQVSANAGKPIFEVAIRDYMLRTPAQPIDIDNIVAITQNYYFKNNSNTSANGSLLKFVAETQGTPPFTYAWNFGDGTAANTEITTHNFAHSGNYQVELVVRDAQNRVQNLSNPVFVPPTYEVCTGNFNQLRTADRTFNFGAIITPDKQPTSIRWDMGDGTIYTNQQYFITHTYRENGVYQVAMNMVMRDLTDTAAAPCMVSVAKRVVTAGTNAAGLGFNYITGYTPTRHNLSTVEVRYTDENDKKYSSIGGLQPQWTSFVVENTEPYLVNENGLPTQKIIAKVSCRLFGDNDYIDLKNAQISFGLAY